MPREIVEKIESFEKRESESVGSDYEKQLILLVRSGAKPAALIEAFGDFEEVGVKEFGKDRQEILNKELARVGDFLQNIGLYFAFDNPRISKLKDENDNIILNQEFVDVLIAHSETDLNRLKGALSAGDSDENLGLALGYPATAVEAYMGKRPALDKRQLAEDIKNSEAYPFIEFVISKDNWQEELKVADAWARAVKKNSPTLFEEKMNTFSDHEVIAE